jgi:magnesium transporter
MEQIRPWDELKSLIETENIEDIKVLLDQMTSEDVAGAVNHLANEERLKLMSFLLPDQAAEVMEDIHPVQAQEIIRALDHSEAAAIINELPSDEQADLLTTLDKTEAESIILKMDFEEAENLRKLIEYDPDTAGGMMITEFLSYDENTLIREVVKDLSDNSEKYERYNIQYLYVTSDGKFIGVLRMRDLLLNKPNLPLSKIVLPDVLSVNENDSLDELISFFDTYDFYGVPVINDRQELIGVVLRKNIREKESDRDHFEHLETQGIVGGEELRSMPVLLRSRRRLSWLSVNILLNILAASVIAFYEETLSSVIALAVFLPIISDMSGCSGNQAVAVSLRELSLGLVKPFEVLRVWLQEVSLGLINGFVLGSLIGAAAWLWKGNIYLGMVVGGALAVNTVIAVSIGGTIPLFLKKMNVDPALASGPILTTITDMIGFLLALSFATLMLQQIMA